MMYRDYNDYELISYVHENNEEANNIVIEKYQPLIYMISNRMYKHAKNSGLELNDLIQEGMIGLSDAVNSFSEQKDTCFYTYAKTCIERKIISAIISSQRQKHKILNESLSYDSLEDPAYNFLKDDSDPLDIVISSDEELKIEKKIKNKLTPFENQVFDLMVAGFNYKEISDMLNKDNKSIDNAIQRIRNKSRDILKIEK